MRASYLKQLETLHAELIRMGALCEEAIQNSTQSLLSESDSFREKALEIEDEINRKELEIEALCGKLLLHEQPVAGDFRQITAAQRMIIDLERIGDQAANIAKISSFIKGHPLFASIPISHMAQISIQMLTDSLDSYIGKDLSKAHAVIEHDDIVDTLLKKIRKELVRLMAQDHADGGACLDLLMIAKYFERIGDHAENIAEWVIYSITGQHRHKENMERETL